MFHIAILSASVRTGRNSHRVAQYFRNYLEENRLASAEIVDLNEYQFPIFNERLRFQKEPDAKTLEFASRIRSADGVLIVTPEYNGGYPAALKNVVDLLYSEWHKKPTAISTVSDGNFGGMQVITSIQYTLWKMHALTVPFLFPVPKIREAFDENGTPTDKAATDKRAAVFIKELLWMVEAVEKMKT